MKHVTSNDASFVESTVQQAITTYRKKGDVAEAINGLTKLKGIGPATASLILAVHDPENAIFFSDEAFWWLCCHGKKDPIKYNTKEYQELTKTGRKLIGRIGVRAVDVEKVAYVVMKTNTTSIPGNSVAENTEPTAKAAKSMSSKDRSQQPPAKRKDIADEDQGTAALRRSKRAKAT